MHLRQGRDGEIAVGQFLERLREGGAQVFHDICGPGFNVDHLVIAEQGIYVIETKTYSKPAGRKACIDFDGQTLLMDGQPFISDPTAQACAAAAWIRRLIRELTGRDFRPRAVRGIPGLVHRAGGAETGDGIQEPGLDSVSPRPCRTGSPGGRP